MEQILSWKCRIQAGISIPSPTGCQVGGLFTPGAPILQDGNHPFLPGQAGLGHIPEPDLALVSPQPLQGSCTSQA